ncbi:MAG: APC family permease [Sphingomonas sp.]|uniref:APC family permease n=1 Tax=Sphingomonas sp. TaxID=28214 RepID=UPI0035A93D19|nr:APC family permease [Sphingomonas sp.]
MTSPPPTTFTNGKLIRSVGLWGLIAMVLNGLIGAGIFGLPASVTNSAGGWAPVIVLLVGLAMLPIVLVVARLARLFDGTGGPIQYVEAAFGTTAAFQIGWMQLLSTTASAAANVNLLADYALRGWGMPESSLQAHMAVVLGALLLIFIVNLNRTNGVARILGVLSVMKLAPLALLIVLAIPLVVSDGASVHPASTWSLSRAALLSAYAFTGFEGALTLAGEARNPKRDMPRAVVGVFLAVSLLYALLVWGYVATAYSPSATDTAPLSTMAMVLIGSAGAVLMLATATLSIFGNITNNMLFLSRRLLALEALGGLPRWFGQVSPKDAVPRNAVIFIMVVLVGLSLSGGFAALAVLSVASRLIVYLGCIAALPVIERRHDPSGSVRTGLIVVAAASVCLALIAGSEAKSWISLGVAAIIGIAVYSVTRAVRSRDPIAAI